MRIIDYRHNENSTKIQITILEKGESRGWFPGHPRRTCHYETYNAGFVMVQDRPSGAWDWYETDHMDHPTNGQKAKDILAELDENGWYIERETEVSSDGMYIGDPFESKD